MADTTVGGLINVTSASIGSVAITGIQSINWDVSRVLVPSPPADGEAYGGTPFQGSADGVSGTITFSNAVDADTVGSLTGTLQATGTQLGGQTGKVLQIQNVVFDEPSTTGGKNTGWTSTIAFRGGSEDGTTSPVSLT